MATVKIITSAKHKHGQKNVIPHLKGETLIGIDGTVEVSDIETAHKVIASVPDFSLIESEEEIGSKKEKALKPKAEENKLGQENGNALTSETGNTGDDSDKDKKDEDEDKPMSETEADSILKNKTLVQLQTMAKDAGLAEETWGSLQKPELKVYLKGILTSTTAQ